MALISPGCRKKLFTLLFVNLLFLFSLFPLSIFLSLTPRERALDYLPERTARKYGAVYVQISETDSAAADELLNCALHVIRAAANVHFFVDIYISTVPSISGNNEQKAHFDLLQELRKKTKKLGHVLKVEPIPVDNGIDVFMKQLQASRDIVPYEYTAVLKVHSKSDEIWRERGIEAMCGTTEQVESIWKKFHEDSEIDMIVPLGVTVGIDTNETDVFPHMVKKNELKSNSFDNAFNLEFKEMFNSYFRMLAPRAEVPRETEIAIVGGGMYWVRHATLRKEILDMYPKSTPFNFQNTFDFDHQDSIDLCFPTTVRAKHRKIAEISPAPKVVAIYFPQYHNSEENNRFWGHGFTEWTFLKPFKGDYIRKPLAVEDGGLGYYNLENIEARRRQGELARKSGVHGFMYYHYWFSGDHAPPNHKVLYKIPELLLIDGEPNLPFMFSWANEPWTRRWSGSETADNVLLSQSYGVEEDWEEHLDYLIPFFRHPLYIKVRGEPVFAIYRSGHLKDTLPKMVALWKKSAVEKYNLKGLRVISTLGGFFKADEGTEERDGDLDGSLHFVPHFFWFFKRKTFASSTESMPIKQKNQYWGAFSGFDNRPRMPASTNRQLVGPAEFSDNMKCSFEAMSYTGGRTVDTNLYFIAAWNEWNEQSVLEPDTLNKFAYLDGIQSNVKNMPTHTRWLGNKTALHHNCKTRFI